MRAAVHREPARRLPAKAVNARAGAVRKAVAADAAAVTSPKTANSTSPRLAAGESGRQFFLLRMPNPWHLHDLQKRFQWDFLPLPSIPSASLKFFFCPCPFEISRTTEQARKAPAQRRRREFPYFRPIWGRPRNRARPGRRRTFSPERSPRHERVRERETIRTLFAAIQREHSERFTVRPTAWLRGGPT